MKDEIKEKEKHILEELKSIDIEELRPDIDKIIESNLKRKNFPLIMVWLWKKFQKDDFVYADDLAEFLGVSRYIAYEYLREFCRLGLLYKKTVTRKLLIEFRPVRNDGKMLLERWVPKAWEELKRRRKLKK